MREINNFEIAIVSADKGWIAIIDRTYRKEVKKISILNFNGIIKPSLAEVDRIPSSKALFIKDKR